MMKQDQSLIFFIISLVFLGLVTQILAQTSNSNHSSPPQSNPPSDSHHSHNPPPPRPPPVHLLHCPGPPPPPSPLLLPHHGHPRHTTPPPPPPRHGGHHPHGGHHCHAHPPPPPLPRRGGHHQIPPPPRSPPPPPPPPRHGGHHPHGGHHHHSSPPSAAGSRIRPSPTPRPLHHTSAPVPNPPERHQTSPAPPRTHTPAPAPPQHHTSPPPPQHHNNHATSPPPRSRPKSTPPPPPPPPQPQHHHTSAPEPNQPESRQPRADLVKGLKKSENCKSSKCSKGRLFIPGMVGSGVLVSDSVIVSKDGSGDLKTIEEAVQVAPDNLKSGDGYFVIYIKRGVYEEYINIPKHKTNILILGDGINETIITGNRSASAGFGTSPSATFTVAGEGFIAIDTTFRNTFGEGSQAVAMRSKADKSGFFRCSFDGFQDTLLVDALRQFYRDCDVYGTVDFIFGDATVVFQNSRILPRLHGSKKSRHSTVVVAAHGRDESVETTGISFHNCTVDAAPDLAAEEHRQRRRPAFLGRPWGPYARTVYMQSYIGDMYNSDGWKKMNGGNNENLYFGEYRNHGPGADTSKRVDWDGVRKTMTTEEAMEFTVHNFIDGGSWLPQTCIPFNPDLI